jgi:hypothetical protein
MNINRFVFTKKHYFQQKLNHEENFIIPDSIIHLVSSEIKNNNHKGVAVSLCRNVSTSNIQMDLDNELKSKLLNEFTQFNDEFKKISEQLEIKNFLSFDFIKEQLIEFNTKLKFLPLNLLKILWILQNIKAYWIP